MIVIIDNISDREWCLILSALKKESSNNAFNATFFPKRKEDIDKLIDKIEGNKPKFTLSHRTDR